MRDHLPIQHRGAAVNRTPPEPTLAMTVCLPFFEVLAARGLLPEFLTRSLTSSRPEDRVPLRTALAMLDGGVAISNDPDLGLRAALRNSLSVPLLEYAAASSSTVRESLNTLARYIMVVNEGFDIRLTVEGPCAVLEFNDDRMPMGRAAIDFALGSFYLRRMLWGVVAPNDAVRCQVWFRYSHPLDTSVHDTLFKRAILVFDASRHAIVFPADRLDLPTRRPDPVLHDLLVQSIDEQMMKLSTEMRVTPQVRAILREGIATNGSAEFVSERMGVSPRTLCRRLTSEGTSFQKLLDEVRCGLALRHLIGERMSVSQTAQRLGYSEANSFHRAFRRWFGTSPSEYLAAVRRRS